MKKIALIKKEKEILDKYWFLVKKNYAFTQLLSTTIKIFIFLIIVWQLFAWIWFLFLSAFYEWNIYRWSINSIFLTIFIFVCMSPVWLYIKDYLHSGKVFYSNNQIISFWNIHKNKLSWINKGILFFEKFYNTFSRVDDTYFKAIFGNFILKIYFLLFLVMPGFIIYNSWLILVITSILCWFLSLNILRHLYQSFHPLYAFWNIWEKIQALTPEIGIQSAIIQNELKTSTSDDIDYRNLHNAFDNLSHTFYKIVSLVIRLEHIEKRANKWNLFDSLKYIHSLKDDILSPLDSLDIFLEEKVSALRAKEIELRQVRVKVWWIEQWGDPWHLSLTSTRIWPLITEIERQRSELALMREKIRAL